VIQNLVILYMREDYLDLNLSQTNPSDKIISSFYKIKFSTTYFNLLQYVGSFM